MVLSIPKVRVKQKIAINLNQLADIAFVFYFCNPLIKRIVSFIYAHLGITFLETSMQMMMIVLPAVLLLMISPKKLPVDFLALWIIILFFFVMTYAVHPEYGFWYFRNYYGVWDYVLRPDNGLYAFFFLRIVSDSERILKDLKISSWIMYPYYAYVLLGALRRGYWENTNSSGKNVQMAYDLSFGYDVVFFMLVFLYFALRDRKPIDIIMSLAGVAMILMGGSRGPLVCIAVFLVLYFYITLQKSPKRRLIIGEITGGLILLSLLYKHILNLVIVIFDRLDISSRTLTMLVEGSISDDNGREIIWKTAIQMIRDNPLGYGAMGTRHVIYYVHNVGHCHQFILEFLVDYGVILAPIMFIVMIFGIIKMLTGKISPEWKMVLCIFLARATQLMLSGTYWHVFSFWGCLGIASCILHVGKESQIKQQVRRWISGKYKIANQ